MSGSEIAALVASLVSAGIAILAIWLSIKFYEMTTKQAESSREAAKDISAAVSRLEKLFDSLYGDMWSMTKETVAEVRKHAWGDVREETSEGLSKAAEEANAKFDELRSGVMSHIEEIIQKQKKTDLNVESMKAQLESAVDSGMKAARKLDQEEMKRVIRMETLHLALQHMPLSGHENLASFLQMVAKNTGIDQESVTKEFSKMKNERLFRVSYTGGWVGNPGQCDANLTKAGRRAAEEVTKHKSSKDQAARKPIKSAEKKTAKKKKT